MQARGPRLPDVVLPLGTEDRLVMTPTEAREALRCMAYTTRGDRCRRRMICGKYEGGRYVLCAAHARVAGWPIWMWGR